jgi:hypothetical protein
MSFSGGGVREMNKFRFAVGKGRTKLFAEVMPLGEDLTILIYGGKAHIGSIAVAIPRPSLADSRKTSSTVSVYNLAGHKDDRLSQPLAREIAARTGRVVTVIAGFHLDNIGEEEIKQVVNNLKIIERIILKKID